MLREASYYTAMARGLYHYLRTPSPHDAGALIRQQLQNREEIFLDTVRRAVFSRSDHPYHEMFRLAGCDYQGLADAVRREGLETTLASLHRQGVYLAHDELKGKQAIVRSGRHIPSNDNSFLNPLAQGLMESASSGSRSQGTRTRRSTAHQIHCEAYWILKRLECRLAGRAQIELRPILPSIVGLATTLHAARSGRPAECWFTASGTWGDSGHYRVVTGAMVLLANLMGTRVPFPTPLPPNDFAPVAQFIARRRAEGVACVLGGFVSPATRVAAAAIEKGLDISGTFFNMGGEALTYAKRRLIEAAGGEASINYWAHEAGPIGMSCGKMTTGDSVHLLRDSMAAISYRRMAPLAEVEVNSLLFTTLLPFALRVLINAELDDSGVIEPARCDCTFSAAGFTEQIRDIRSFGKLTGQGMTLMGTDMLRILEEVLPERFGGGPGDYQLVEQEAGRQTRLVLRVSPRTGVTSSDKISEYFLKEIRKHYGGALAARAWRHAEAVETIIAQPLATANGKVHALHLLGSSEPKFDEA
jgi:hypothetical protein